MAGARGQCGAMANQRAEPKSGGIFIAIGSLGGVFVGRLYGETSIGLLAGFAIGSAVALAIWWADRRN